jgi:hypothetical protein
VRLQAAAASLLAAAIAASCGSQTTPTLFTTNGNAGGSLSGVLVRYGDGAPLAGVTVLTGGRAALTDAQGRFQLNGIADSGTTRITVSPDGYLSRGLTVALAPARSGVTVDVIQDATPFSSAFYRQFVRNGWESLTLTPTAPWTVNPNFYVKMTVEGTTGYRMTDDVADRIRDVIAASVPELSGGKLRMAAFERGDATRAAADGWVNITFFEQLDSFGRSSVGGDSGTMSIRYFVSSNPNTNPYNCYTPEVQWVDHEITHTMGYWHTQNSLVDTFSGNGCPGSGRPDYVVHHARVMYSRPKGNRDPDLDPTDAVLSTAPGRTTATATVACPAGVFVR